MTSDGTTSIVFKTPGQIDMRSFTTMGVNAKPKTDKPIGYFGTGLKYAVAVLARLGATVVVHTGGDRYTFETKKMKFREQDFDQIVMRRDRWGLAPLGTMGMWKLGRRVKLPYTTQYGRNWEAWMAFRELYSNTLDEVGTCEEIARGADDYWIFGEEKDQTHIVVSNCPSFVDAFRNLDNIFVNLSTKKKVAVLPGLEILEGQTQKMFYQGMRAKDIGKPTMFTYNFTHGQDLTEDRQLAHEWRLKTTLANIIATKTDDEALITTIITAPKEMWEHEIAPDAWVQPSRAFHNVMMRRPRGVAGGWGGYYGGHDNRPEVHRENLWKDALRPWVVDGGDILAADGTPLLSKPFNMNDIKWQNLAKSVCVVANRNDAQWFVNVVGADIPPQRAMLASDLWTDHDLWTGEEPNAPEVVVRGGLGVCRVCGLGESELEDTPQCPGPRDYQPKLELLSGLPAQCFDDGVPF